MTRTLMHVLTVALAAPMMAAAQVPPTPPPARPAAPAAEPRPARPPALISPRHDFEFEFLVPRVDEIRLKAEEMRLHAMEFSKVDMEQMRLQASELAMLARVDAEQVKMQAEELKLLSRVDVEQIRAQAEEMRHLSSINADEARRQAEEVKRMAMVDMPTMPDLFRPSFGKPDRFLEARPRAPWAHEDPADSLYRVGREALNRGEYRRAAQIFNEVTKKFPRSQYALDSAYWEAFARYRTGGTEDLREALKILDDKSTQFASLRNEGNVDVQALRTRVLGALASRGDSKAADELRRNAAQTGSCDREEISVRAEALSALGQMDMTAAMPAVRKVLLRRDECTVELRRRALYLLARQPGNDAVGLILDVAKNDTDAGIRGEAMRWLPRVAGDSAVPQLEELLRTAADEQTQRSVINALGSIDSDRARRAVRTIIERNDALERVRYDAILSLSRERENRVVSPEDMNYLRSLYTKLEAARLREAVLTSISRVPAAENEQFLLAVARNVNETPSLRAAALQRVGRMNTVSVADIAKLYEVADSRAMREQILSALSQRKEPEAIDKMIEIARKDTDPHIRRTAINYLQRSNNERAKQFIQGLFDK